MPTPKEVQKKAKEADRLYHEAYGQQTEAEPVQSEDQEAAEIVAQADAPETPPDEQAAEAPPEQEVNEPEPEAPAVQEPVAEEPQKKRGGSDDWEQKYRTLQGMNQALREQLQGMQTVLATLQNQQAQPDEAEAKPAPRFLKDDEISEYGEELIDIMRRVVREETHGLSDRLNRVAQSSESLTNGLTNVSKSMAQSARKSVYVTLAESVPNWEAINKDASFLEWLGEVDAYAGRKRSEMLKEAFEANDAARVVRFFKGFLNETASLAQDESEPTQTTRSPRASLSQMVAPGRPRGGSAGATPQDGKKLWTHAEVQQFYRDIQKGKYKGKDKDRLRIERDIIAAANEGRIAA